MSGFSRRIAAAMVALAALSTGRGAWAENPRTGCLASPAGPATAPATTTLQHAVETTIASELDRLEKDGDIDAAITHLDGLFDAVTTLGTDRALDAFRDAGFARRLVHQLKTVPEDSRIDTLKFLRAHDTLAHTLVFMVEPPEKALRTGGPYDILAQLREKHADQLEKYANLAAAICVVHDRPFTRRINESMTTSPTPEEIFTYYTGNEKKLLFGVKNVPAELLVYVVDTTASIEDMTWALNKYAGDQSIGSHFFDVAYDYENFHTGRPKKVTENYTLPNILKYGGVCADQAFFAMAIGKAIGVPTAYAVGESGESGHAWVGFLQAAGDKGFWNFDVGRYPEYKGVRGNVIDPQTRKSIPDSYVSVLGELIGRTVAQRRATVALADGAARLSGTDGGDLAPMDLGTITDARVPARTAVTADALELLEMALNQNSGYPRAWFEARQLAQDGKLDLPQKIKWSNAVLKLCGAKYPDFAAALLEPMIATVDDPAQQNKLWEAAFVQFQARKDLGADIRMHEAKLWEKNDEITKAGQCYEDVIERYANAGPFVIAALSGAEKLLEGKDDKILKLYELTWGKTQKPQQMAAPYMRQSNWYRVGTMYAGKLKDAGQFLKADAVLTQLGAQPAAAP